MADCSAHRHQVPLAPTWAENAKKWSKSGQIQHIWSKPGQIRSKSGHMWSKPGQSSSKSGPSWSKSGQSSSNPGKIRSKSGRAWSNGQLQQSGQSRSKSGHMWPNSGQIQAKSGQMRSKSGQIGLTLSNVGINWPRIGACLAKFGRRRSKLPVFGRTLIGPNLDEIGPKLRCCKLGRFRARSAARKHRHRRTGRGKRARALWAMARQPDSWTCNIVLRRGSHRSAIDRPDGLSPDLHPVVSGQRGGWRGCSQLWLSHRTLCEARAGTKPVAESRPKL